MKTAVIFANGELAIPGGIQPLDNAHYIAADGGAIYALALGVKLDTVIGDLDSLSAEEVHDLRFSGVEIIQHPADKNETDLELALDYVLSAGCQTVIMYGLLGNRWDMSFANILMLADERFSSMDIRIIHGAEQMTILRGGNQLELQGTPGDTVSVLPLTPTAEGITYTGLTFPLEDAVLPFGSPRGVSNQMANTHAQLTLSTGVLLVIHTKSLETL